MKYLTSGLFLLCLTGDTFKTNPWTVAFCSSSISNTLNTRFCSLSVVLTTPSQARPTMTACMQAFSSYNVKVHSHTICLTSSQCFIITVSSLKSRSIHRVWFSLWTWSNGTLLTSSFNHLKDLSAKHSLQLLSFMNCSIAIINPTP